jgi:hypothetical protein
MDGRTRGPAGFLALVCLLTGLLGCVGPTTPLGAVDDSIQGPEPSSPELADAEPGPDDPGAADPAEESARILFTPNYQQVHGPYTWRVLVVDPAAGRPDATQLRVYYNGLEVTAAAHFQFRLEYRPAEEEGAEALLLEMPHLRLGPLEDHEIFVRYTAADGRSLQAAYPFPAVEDLEAEEPLSSTRPFSVDPAILTAVYEASRRFRLNPVLLAALIAQESSFDPYALSKAHALGLTQVTHLAEEDIALAYPSWPRYPGIRRLSRRKLRRLIPKTINGKNEWRLDPVKSVWGGAYYLAYLRDRLSYEGNRLTVALAGGAWDPLLTEACLASYNSGLNRVLNALRKYRSAWLEQPSTREAKLYVRKILSFYGAFRVPEEAPAGGGGQPS